MKKLLTKALLLLITLTADAQEGTWSTGMIEADELKGLVGGPYYRYDVEGVGGIIIRDWEDWYFTIFTDKGKFDVLSASNGNRYIKISMGLYTPEGNLIERFENSIQADDTKRNSAWINKNWMYLPGDRKKIKKMIRALKSGEGRVRIVCKRKDMQDFDLKITKYDITEENSTAYKEFTQVVFRSTPFCDVNDYSTPDDIMVAEKDNNLKSWTLKKGERFKVLSLDRQSMYAKVQLPNGKIGWVNSQNVLNTKDFLPHLPFREEFLSNIETHAVAPGMTREEFFIVTGTYLNSTDKKYRESGDYVTYHYPDADFMFYKNSLYFATSCKGAFWFRSLVNYKLVNVSRNDSVMDNNISSDVPTSFRDELISVSWIIDRNRVNFNLKDNASSSIKIPWDDMALVGLDGESQRIIHKGIKYSEKEKEQAPSVIARNTELNDILIPTNNIYYKESWAKWSAHPLVSDCLYSPEDEASKHPDGKKIQVLLPIIVNEKRYEYQFVFEIEDIKFSLMNSDYNNSSRATDELY